MRCAANRIVTLLAVVLIALTAKEDLACTMSLPRSFVPENEYEIEVEYEGYDRQTDKIRYKIEVEVELFAPTQPVQCQCALGLGDTTSPAPLSFDVTSAVVGIRGDSEVDLIPFDGFARDNDVEDTVSGLSDFVTGASAFGFSLDVSPFVVPPLDLEDLLALIFEIELDPDHYDRVNGMAIQFAAGSSEAGHELSVFQGYEPVLELPRPIGVPITGDFDEDGELTGADLDAICSQSASGQHSGSFDLNGDGLVDSNDVAVVMSSMGVLPGDADLDGEVAFADFLVLSEHFGEQGAFSDGDFDCSGGIEFSDFLVLSQNFGNSVGAFTTVPEPSWSLLVSSFTLLAAFRRSRRT